MKVSCVQMAVKLAEVENNLAHIKELIRQAAQEKPDVIVLPETWNIGFFPKDNLASYCDNNGEMITREIGGLAKELGINIVAGSVGNIKEDGKVYNTAFVFNRQGECVYTYDKIHLFSPGGEHEYFTFGNHYGTFQLDGVNCGMIICYDVRFLELVRSIRLKGVDMFFVVSEWPALRAEHLDTLCHARSIENQMCLALCNAVDGGCNCGGGSTMFDAWGVRQVKAGTEEEIITADLDMSTITNIRSSINVMNDRQVDLYDLSYKAL